MLNQYCMLASLPCPQAQGQAQCTLLSQRTGSRPSLSWSVGAPAPPCPSHDVRGMRAAGGFVAPGQMPGCGTACSGTPGQLVNSSSPSFLVMRQAQEKVAVTPYTNRVAVFWMAASQKCQADLLWNGISSLSEDITSGLPASPVSFCKQREVLILFRFHLANMLVRMSFYHLSASVKPTVFSEANLLIQEMQIRIIFIERLLQISSEK